ncbi:MAG: imidazole glycerol phosphate synthase subunit HisH [Alphaproteobacteria bacterium]|nr:imidazole glycerol phosphate synthase subunit HisH [Alphaproteobacteria bacterium]
MIVSIVNYEAGNLKSVANAIARAGGQSTVARTPEDISVAERLILPGVGAAGSALARLRKAGMDEALTEAVLRRGTPILGICLGMQLMAERLYEYGDHRGLGWIQGDVVALDEFGADMRRVPHTGWSEVEETESWGRVFGAVSGQATYYFNHSFALRTEEISSIAARTPVGGPIPAAIVRDNIAATQFHPEISQKAGRRLLSAFLNWSP